MNCKQFLPHLETHWDRHAGEPAPRLPRELASHAEACPRCAARLRTGQLSRQLLFSLRPPAPDATESERQTDLFVARLRRRLEQREAAPAWLHLRVRWRDLAVAGAVFAITLTSFVYNVRRTETPDISEAEVLDVPHVNWQHPSDDHRAGATDVFLSLLNP